MMKERLDLEDYEIEESLTPCIRNICTPFSLCKRNIDTEFHYVDIDHAFFNLKNQGRLLVCENCAKIVIKIFSGSIAKRHNLMSKGLLVNEKSLSVEH